MPAIRTENAEGRRWVPLGRDAHLLTYRVSARWEHEDTKSVALASSVYIRRDGAWNLAFHQQMPMPEDAVKS